MECESVTLWPPFDWEQENNPLSEPVPIKDVEKGHYIVLNKRPCLCTKKEPEGYGFRLTGEDIFNNEIYSEFYGDDDELFYPTIVESYQTVKKAKVVEGVNELYLRPWGLYENHDPEMFERIKNDVDNEQFLLCTVRESIWNAGRVGGDTIEKKDDKIVNYPSTAPEQVD